MNTWQRATQAAENLTRAIDEAQESFCRVMVPIAQQIETAKAAIAAATGYEQENMGVILGDELRKIQAEHGATGYTFGPLHFVDHIWLRRPKSKSRRQWKKWQRLHKEAEKTT